jgi:carboxylesterase type B
MSTAWVNFAKTGNPNGGDLPQWDAYTRENGNVMILITKSRLNNITMRSYSAYWLRK